MKKQTILLVDDQPENINILAESLRQEYRLIIAVNGAEALRCAHSSRARPDIILLDVIMEDMSGYQVCRHLKADAKTSGIPVIFVTGLDSDDDQETGLELGAVDYITKPFRISIVKARIKTHLELKAHQDRLEGLLQERLVELQKTTSQLYQAQKMKTLGTLVAGVAHEINNPVNLLLFNLTLLQKIWVDCLPLLQHHSLNRPAEKYGGLTFAYLEENLTVLLADSEMAANRIAKIVLDLKVFSRQTNISDKKPLSLNEAVKNALRLAKNVFKNSTIQVNLDLAKGLPLLAGNLQGLEQIVMNLALNAFQAIDHDRGVITISTRFDEGKNLLRLGVEDNGKGIDPELRDKIFDPFVTDKESEGGTGLGLAITYSLVKAHNGEIEVRSSSGKGTEFTIFFPELSGGEEAS